MDSVLQATLRGSDTGFCIEHAYAELTSIRYEYGVSQVNFTYPNAPIDYPMVAIRKDMQLNTHF